MSELSILFSLSIFFAIHVLHGSPVGFYFCIITKVMEKLNRFKESNFTYFILIIFSSLGSSSGYRWRRLAIIGCNCEFDHFPIAATSQSLVVAHVAVVFKTAYKSIDNRLMETKLNNIHTVCRKYHSRWLWLGIEC